MLTARCWRLVCCVGWGAPHAQDYPEPLVNTAAILLKDPSTVCVCVCVCVCASAVLLGVGGGDYALDGVCGAV